MPATITHAKSNTIADFTGTVTVLNSSGGTVTMAATNLVRPVDWNSNHQMTLLLHGSEQQVLSQFYCPFPPLNAASTLTAPGQATWYMQPFVVPMQMDSGQLRVFWSAAAGFLNGAVYSATSTGSMAHSQTWAEALALYRKGTGASTTRWESVWSTQISILATWSQNVSGSTSNALSVTKAITVSYPFQWDASGGMTYTSSSQSATTSVGASTGASTLASGIATGVGQIISGLRNDLLPLASRLPAGDYILAHMNSSTSATAGTRYTAGTMIGAHSRLGIAEYTGLSSMRRMGKSVSDSSGFDHMRGFFATTSTSPPANFATSDMRESHNQIYWQYQKTNY